MNISKMIIKIVFEHTKKTKELYYIKQSQINEIWDLFEDIPFNFEINGEIVLNCNDKNIYMIIEDQGQDFHTLNIYFLIK